jgi:glutaredoxin-like protein NrdH
MSEHPSAPRHAHEATAIVLYTQPHCTACRSVERYLTDRGVTFEVCDVFADPVALSEIEDRGYLTTPVTRIGTQWLAGFRPREFDAALAHLARSAEQD